MTDEKKTVTVCCSHPGGLRIQIDPIEGEKGDREIPRAYVLNGPANHGTVSGLSNPTPSLEPGRTEVDPRFWAAYVKQHGEVPNGLLANGTIFEAGGDGEPKEDGTLPEKDEGARPPQE